MKWKSRQISVYTIIILFNRRLICMISGLGQSKLISSIFYMLLQFIISSKRSIANTTFKRLEFQMYSIKEDLFKAFQKKVRVWVRVRSSKIEVRCASACETKLRVCVRRTVKFLATQRLIVTNFSTNYFAFLCSNKIEGTPILKLAMVKR